ncbi:cell cycle checkpoint protein rad1-like [Lichtheimia corymbifera JMRC:FSU:9682]|uniref:Cell cycle checkpoint protein rad1-like n=1 Tax=Lichtheimia corymbifera JMRC:FSU:9682 TaxID=1263082 RepID=A0A068S7S9_9FUNG|nr:cell cycle checkpoint protein rad1-like [Lichtheimia corymbifera JMRC:FSU:9682]
MPHFNMTSSSSSSPLLVGELMSVRSLNNLLRAMNSKNVATCHILDEGITFTVMEGRHVKMVAYLKRNLFDTYRIQAGSDPIQPFGVSIGTMLDCLGILMPAPGETVDACKIRYMEEGQPVEFNREDPDHEVRCSLVTLEPELDDESLTLSSDIQLRAIMRSSALNDALGDLDKSCDRITFKFSPENPQFYLKGESDQGMYEIEYPGSSETFISFQCEGDVMHCYHYSHFMHCKRALEQSDEVSIRVSQDGVLCLLFRLQSSSRESYVEFTILPYSQPDQDDEEHVSDH